MNAIFRSKASGLLVVSSLLLVACGGEPKSIPKTVASNSSAIGSRNSVGSAALQQLHNGSIAKENARDASYYASQTALATPLGGTSLSGASVPPPSSTTNLSLGGGDSGGGLMTIGLLAAMALPALLSGGGIESALKIFKGKDAEKTAESAAPTTVVGGNSIGGNSVNTAQSAAAVKPAAIDPNFVGPPTKEQIEAADAAKKAQTEKSQALAVNVDGKTLFIRGKDVQKVADALQGKKDSEGKPEAQQAEAQKALEFVGPPAPTEEDLAAMARRDYEHGPDFVGPPTPDEILFAHKESAPANEIVNCDPPTAASNEQKADQWVENVMNKWKASQAKGGTDS